MDNKESMAFHSSKMSPEKWMISVADAELAQGITRQWNWGEGTLMYAIMRTWAHTENKRYFNYVKRWLDHHIEKGFVVEHGDRCTPGIADLIIYEVSREKRYMKAAEQICHFLFKHAGEVRGERHMVWSRFWVDDIFMICPFLAKMGKITGDDKYYEAAIHQIILYAERLQDRDTELFYHAWFPDQDKTSPCFWGRGNGWALMAATEVLSIVPEDYPRRERMKEILTAHAKALARLQDKSGMWHTVLDREDTYLETSATAMFTYGMAKALREGMIEDRHWNNVKKGWKAITGMVSKNGMVRGVSLGTPPGNWEHYNRVPVGVTTWGTGAFLLAASELALT